MCGQVRKLLDFISPACPRTETEKSERREDSPKKQSKGCAMDTAEFRKRGR
ncbi:hypothetical protein X975_23591, partial [Stegodyphus mimosarum]